jgi:hypothetical protein
MAGVAGLEPVTPGFGNRIIRWTAKDRTGKPIVQNPFISFDNSHSFAMAGCVRNIHNLESVTGSNSRKIENHFASMRGITTIGNDVWIGYGVFILSVCNDPRPRRRDRVIWRQKAERPPRRYGLPFLSRLSTISLVASIGPGSMRNVGDLMPVCHHRRRLCRRCCCRRSKYIGAANARSRLDSVYLFCGL